jgi:hypothetical protein
VVEGFTLLIQMEMSMQFGQDDGVKGCLATKK